MNKLSWLRKLSEKATKAPWYSGDLTVYLGSEYEVDEVLYESQPGPNARQRNNDLICEMRNNIDALLDVVEAAHMWVRNNDCNCEPSHECDWCIIKNRIAKLEGE